eukprot:6471276-Amphidinium_carterae.1
MRSAHCSSSRRSQVNVRLGQCSRRRPPGYITLHFFASHTCRRCVHASGPSFASPKRLPARKRPWSSAQSD